MPTDYSCTLRWCLDRTSRKSLVLCRASKCCYKQPCNFKFASDEFEHRLLATNPLRIFRAFKYVIASLLFFCSTSETTTYIHTPTHSDMHSNTSSTLIYAVYVVIVIIESLLVLFFCVLPFSRFVLHYLICSFV